jgi:integral membrane sensor domain MASE1
MKQILRKSPFDRVMMTGVFIGIVISVISIFYDAIFLESTGFPYTGIINVNSLIFGINILFLAIAPIYYGFTRLPKFGNLIYIIVFVLITILLLLRVKGIERTDNEHLNLEFRHLLTTIIILTAAGIIGLPFLLQSKKFRDKVI